MTNGSASSWGLISRISGRERCMVTSKVQMRVRCISPIRLWRRNNCIAMAAGDQLVP
ncbi:hypothetical protein CY34DRAFT_230600 [Suillus luteus UH-Slu-Lm8-n1]|uniref:Unplaced genomic scaffold CY34scaffold_15, whole genome shotgun sequence n=1 Tax=Suillus luteus UH-Slu-Lm8-n1 TaxID=930992 RepID=A0A0D0BXC3_9AGAM|nr:hypothetical protein CY34DRAFT_230600 [Suillus luteus UH-Slu-Lm8-n1]